MSGSRLGRTGLSANQRLAGTIPRLLILFSCVVFLYAGASEREAEAQGAPSTTTTLATTTTSTPSDTVLSSSDRRFLSAAILALGALVVVIGGAYLFVGLNKYYAAAVSIAGSTKALVPYTATDPVVYAQGLENPTGMNIEGPAAVEVGVPAQFSVKSPDGSSPSSATWKANPADAASITPTEGAAVQVKATAEKSFKLSATVVDDQVTPKVTLVATTDVVAVSKKAESQASLPFVGSGYLTLLVLPMLLAVVALLALNGRVTGEAIVGLAGAALGFLFGKKSSDAAAPADSTET